MVNIVSKKTSSFPRERKYLGVVFDNKLTWTHNTETLINKTNTRLYCLRKLRSFNIDSGLLQIFYSSLIKTVLGFGISCWGGNISMQDKNRLDKVIKKSGSVIGKKQLDLQAICSSVTLRKMKEIVKDQTHPLFTVYNSLLIERSGRYRVPKIKSQRHTNSFIPRSISLFNQSHSRQV